MRRFYLPLADVALVYDNGDKERTLIAERRSNGVFTIHDTARWAMIEKATA
jgi:predicted ABC-type ATPase